MATIKSFEDMLAWQKARKMTIEIHNLFKDSRDFAFKDQLSRACVSIMNNIAEGFERKGDREFRQFLNIAKGSAGEVRSMLYLALDYGYIEKSIYINLNQNCIEISSMLSVFMKHLESIAKR